MLHNYFPSMEPCYSSNHLRSPCFFTTYTLSFNANIHTVPFSFLVRFSNHISIQLSSSTRFLGLFRIDVLCSLLMFLCAICSVFLNCPIPKITVALPTVHSTVHCSRFTCAIIDLFCFGFSSTGHAKTISVIRYCLHPRLFSAVRTTQYYTKSLPESVLTQQQY